jgi:tRNA(His) guanylyltransferase
MRHAGSTARQATAALSRASTAQQNELLYRHGTNFNDLPVWQRRGLGLRWQEYVKTGHDPRTGAEATTVRRRLYIDEQLPLGDDYRAMVATALNASASPAGNA